MASIRKRGKSYTITVYMGYDGNGKQIKKTTTFHPDKNACEKKAEKQAFCYAVLWEHQVKGHLSLNENCTFSELESWYFETIAPNVLKPNVLLNYLKGIKDHIEPYLANTKIKNITPTLLDTIFADLKKGGKMEESWRLKNKDIFTGISRDAFAHRAGISPSTFYAVLRGNTVSKNTAIKVATAIGVSPRNIFENVTSNDGLSASSINKLKRNLSAIFSCAVKKEIILRNPCNQATNLFSPSPKRLCLNEEQCSLLLNLVSSQKDFQFEVIIKLFLSTGIRCGELTALYWEDIDFTNSGLWIRNTLTSVNGCLQRQPPKTKCSMRYIVVPEYILKLLSAHKTMQEKSIKNSATWVNPHLVFTNQAGDYLLCANLNNKLKKLIKDTSLPNGLHIHSLRHTYASILMNAGIPARVIADRLGHSSTKTTLDIYSHVYRENELKSMNTIEEVLFSNPIIPTSIPSLTE